MDRNSYAKERYKLLKQLKICVCCGHQEAEPGITLCLDCNEKKRKYSLAYQKQNCEEIRIKQSENSKKRYYDRKEKGICTKCGKHKIYAKSTIYCIDCYLKEKRRYQKNGIDRSERPAYGLCYQCGKPKEREDISLCNCCHKRSSENMKSLNTNPTQAMLDARELYVKGFRDFKKVLFGCR